MILLTALLATIVIEYGVLLLLGEHRRRVLWASVAINTMTNVPLNLYVQLVSSSLTTIIFGELLVIIIEAVCYYLLTRRVSQASVYSLLCNTISFLIGLLVSLIMLI